MSSLRKRCRNFKKSKANNPYAGRGLDKFAVVTAELEAKREKLAAELDTPLSMVKFAIGSHNKWVPIILSRSAGKESHAPKNKAGTLLNGDKRSSSTGSRQGGSCASRNVNKPLGTGRIKKQKPQSSESVSEITYHGTECSDVAAQTSSSVAGERQESNVQFSSTGNLSKPIDEGALRGLDLQHEGFSGTGREVTVDINHLDPSMQKERMAMGGLMDIDQEDLNEIIEVFSSDGVDHITRYEEETLVFQSRNLQNFMKMVAAVPWVSTIASSAIFLRWSAKGVTSEGKASSVESESSSDAEKAAAIPASNLSPSADKSLATPDVLLLPSTLSPLQIPSMSTDSEQEKASEMEENADVLRPETSNKHHRKCKVKSILKMRSAPSTPRDTRQCKSPFTVATTHRSVLGEKHGHLRDLKGRVEAETQAARTVSSPVVPVKSLFQKVPAPEVMHKQSARRAGHALAAAGLLVSLTGLAVGYVSAIIGIVCWWYVLPVLRKAIGDRPIVGIHHRVHVTNNKLRSRNPRPKYKQIASDEGSGKQRMVKVMPPEYRNVIMEGLRDRGRRSNA